MPDAESHSDGPAGEPSSSEKTRRCPRCGELIPEGKQNCPACSARDGFLSSLEGETLIALTLILLAIFFGVTGYVTGRYHASQKALGGHWYQAGESALNSHHPDQAVDAFRTALVYAKTNPTYQLRLARALIQAGRRPEAESYLRSLWTQEPGSATVNLDLARLAADRADVSDAVRYYHGAIFGVWEGNAIAERRNARFELSQFLISQGKKTEADSELIALEARLPRQPSAHLEAAQLFLDAGDNQHALDEFRDAIQINRKLGSAWAGAGEAAFKMADYQGAEHYFARAVELNHKNTQAAHQLEITRLVLSSNPFERRLSERQRSGRIAADYRRALARLQECAEDKGVSLQVPPAAGSSQQGNGTAPAQKSAKPSTQPASGPLQQAYTAAQSIASKVNSKTLGQEPDSMAGIMNSISQMESSAQQVCGSGSAADEALLLISQRRGTPEK